MSEVAANDHSETLYPNPKELAGLNLRRIRKYQKGREQLDKEACEGGKKPWKRRNGVHVQAQLLQDGLCLQV
ncbi:hypothetical protein INR49_000002 [Caranx melampygus]|nr:hypothetical protein INR49_000002 [Caranx melampygus]